MGIVEGEGGGDGQLFWIMLLVGVGLKSSGDPGRDFSCWELLLQGLLVGLGRGGRWLFLGRVRGRGRDMR